MRDGAAGARQEAVPLVGGVVRLGCEHRGQCIAVDGPVSDGREQITSFPNSFQASTSTRGGIGGDQPGAAGSTPGHMRAASANSRSRRWSNKPARRKKKA